MAFKTQINSLTAETHADLSQEVVFRYPIMAISIGFFDNEPLGYPIIPFPAPERVGKKERHPSAQRKSSRTTGGQPCEGEARLLSYVMLKGRYSL